jgi:hypothetical protein
MKRNNVTPICPYAFSRETKFQDYRLHYLREPIQLELTNYPMMMVSKTNSLVVFDLSFNDIARLEVIYQSMRRSTVLDNTKWAFKPPMKETGAAFFKIGSSYGVFDGKGVPIKAPNNSFIGNVMVRIRGVSISKRMLPHQ